MDQREHPRERSTEMAYFLYRNEVTEIEKTIPRSACPGLEEHLNLVELLGETFLLETFHDGKHQKYG